MSKINVIKRYEAVITKMTFHHLKPVNCINGMKNNILLAQTTSLGAQKNLRTTLYMGYILAVYINATSSSEYRRSGIRGLFLTNR